MQAAQFGEFFRRDVPRCCSGGPALKKAALGIEVGHILGGVLHHACATVWDVFYNPLSGQLLERFTDGHLAHAKLAGYPLLPEPFPWLELAVQNGRPEAIGHYVVELSVLDRVVHDGMRDPNSMK
jgi:hypothetical protein